MSIWHISRETGLARNTVRRHLRATAHFFALAATLMRRILVDHARGKHSMKRGGVADNLPLEETLLVASADNETNTEVLALNEALERLQKLDEQQARCRVGREIKPEI